MPLAFAPTSRNSDRIQVHPGDPGVMVGDGGPVQTNLGFGIVLNKSSLHRVWVTVHDPERARIALDDCYGGTTGVRTIYEPGDSRYARDQYQYEALASVNPVSEATSAFEVRYIVFDIWGNRIKTLSALSATDRDRDREHGTRRPAEFPMEVAPVLRKRGLRVLRITRLCCTGANSQWPSPSS